MFIPVSEKTLQAWQELADVMIKHNIKIDSEKLEAGNDDPWICVNGEGNYYAAKIEFTGQMLSDYVEKCRKAEDSDLFRWF